MNSSSTNKLHALTGLRSIAALAVFAQHFMAIMDCKVIGGPIGGIAVSFFFVLSGFILVYVYKDRLNKTTTPKFYFTRFARIWPLHAVCLLLIAWLIPKFLPPTELPWLRFISHWSLLQAWYPTENWIGCYNGVAWSICAEAFFYLMFPVLLLGTSRRFWIKYACLFAVTFAAMIVMASTFAPASPIEEIASASLDPRKVVQFFPPFRLLEFMTGMAAGVIFLKRKSQPGAFAQSRHWAVTTKATGLEVLALALSIGCYQIFVSCGLFHQLHTFEDCGPTLTHWLSFSGGMFFHAALIYVFAQSAGLIARLAGSRVMVFLGEISFAFYMIHYPLIYFVKQKFWFGTNFSIGYFAVLTLTLSIGVSTWLYYLVETPTKTTLLKWYAGNTSIQHLAAEIVMKPMHRLRQPPLIFALVLLVVVPVVVTKVYQRADRKSFTAEAIIKSASLEFQPVLFGDQIELLAADVVPRRDAARVNTVWRFSSPGTAIVSVHFAGTDYDSRQQEIYCSPELVGQPFVMNMVVYEGKYEAADAVEISVRINGREVTPNLPEGKTCKPSALHYPVYSRERIQEGLRMSRLPVLAR